MSGDQISRVLKYKAVQSCMDDLASASGLDSATKAAEVYTSLAPLVVEAMARTSQSPASVENLLEMSRALTWAERDTPEVLFSERARFGNGLAPLIFGDSMPAILSRLTSTQGVGEYGANTLLETTAVVVLAVVAGPPTNHLSTDVLAAALAGNVPAQQTKSAPGTETITHQAATASAPPAQPASQQPPAHANPAPAAATVPKDSAPKASAPKNAAPKTARATDDDDSKSNLGILVGGLLALVAVAGIGFMTLTGGSGESDGDAAESTPDSIAFDSETETPDTTVASESEGGETGEGGETDPAPAAPVDEELDDKLTLRVPMTDIENSDRDASGILNFTFDTATGEVCYSVESINIQGPYRSHIHVGGADEKGGIVVDLGPLESGDVGCVQNLPIDTNAILADRAGHYAELHDISEEWTIRGQLSEAISDDIVSLSVPMEDIVDADRGASGVLNFEFDTVTGRVCYSVESINIQGPYRTHIHVGTSDEKGGIVVDMGALDSGDEGCVENLPVDTKAILNNKSGHYAELHDISEEWTIRGQLSEATTGDSAPEGGAQVDATGGGASIVLEGGTVFLEGAVPDQATADDMFNSLAGIDSATPVVNNLTVEAGAPLPSGRVVIADAVFFAPNSDDVKAIDDKTLAAITALALSRDDWILTVVGHTDSLGSDVSNLELSLRRASALRDLLAEQGVPEENLRVRGAGETAPIGDNNTAAGRAENRRIEFEFTPSS